MNRNISSGDSNDSHSLNIEIVIVLMSVTAGLISIISYFLKKWRKQRLESFESHE